MRSVPGSGWLYAAGVLAQTALDAETILREGACVLMLRHAQTEAGVGNPPNFNLAQCSTQRNLSEAGRAQSRQIGQWLSSRRLRPRRVASSPWPRRWLRPSTTAARRPASRALRALLAAVPAGQFDVWVTHQVGITALTGEGPAISEAMLLGPAGKVLLRTRQG